MKVYIQYLKIESNIVHKNIHITYNLFSDGFNFHIKAFFVYCHTNACDINLFLMYFCFNLSALFFILSCYYPIERESN